MRSASRRTVVRRRSEVASSTAPASSTMKAAALEMPRSGSFRSWAAACAKESRSSLVRASSAFRAASRPLSRPDISRHSSPATTRCAGVHGALRPRTVARWTADEPRGVSRSPPGPVRTGRAGSAAHSRGAGSSCRHQASRSPSRLKGRKRRPAGTPWAWASAGSRPSSSGTRSLLHTSPTGPESASRSSRPRSPAGSGSPAVGVPTPRSSTAPSAWRSSASPWTGPIRASGAWAESRASSVASARRYPESSSACSRSATAASCRDSAIPKNSQAARTSGVSRFGSSPWHAIRPHSSPSCRSETDMDEATPMLRRYSRW
ncbi:hypothetical protein SMICM304S_03100 [Streptomyces microflavus]